MDIVEELRKDRESGARRLETEYKAGLMILARRLYDNPSDAEELVNRTFAAVVEGIDGFLEQSSLFTWMCRILNNIYSMDNRRKSSQAIMYPGTVPDVADEDAQEEIYRNLDVSFVRTAVESLPEDLKKAVILHYFMDMPVREVARVLSTPTGTVAWRLHCARDILAAKLGVTMEKTKEAAKKPGVKATLAVLALCATAALGAAGVAAFHAATNAQSTMHNAQCASPEGARFGATATGGTGETSATGGSSPVAPVTTPVPPVITPPATPLSHSPTHQLSNSTLGEQNMNTATLRTIVASAAFAAATGAPLMAAASTTYTWEPVDGNWDTATGNWNDGIASGVSWVDDSASPNNAVFGSSAARKSVSVGSARYVNNLNVGEGYTFNGPGPVSVAGTVTLTGTDNNFMCPLASIRDDGSLHIAAASDWKIGYFTGANQQSATYLEGRVYFAPGSDAVFGPVPAEPTENIFVSGTNTIYGNVSCTINGNRTIKISSGYGLQTGGSAQLTYNNMIVAEPDEGLKWSSDTFVTIRNDWTSLVTFDPGAARTNAFGRLRTYGRLKLASGVTAVTGPSGATGGSAVLYVKGNENSFSATHGNLLIDGGELYAPQSSRFVDVRLYGQVTVTNGGKVYMPNVEWINGLYTPGRLTIADGGEVTLDKLRISQCSYAQSEIHLDEGGILKANSIYINEAEAQKVLFRFNGGAVQARNASIAFITNPTTSRYGKARFAVGEKGAVFDTSNGQDFRWSRPLVSDAEADGGVRKFGSGTLVFTTTNAYNGVTSIESGMLQVRQDNGIPSGTTLRLSGTGVLDCYTGDSESPARNTANSLARVEGSGWIDHSSNLHVSGSIAPSPGGAIRFSNVCDLSGDYEIAAAGGQCGRIRLDSAGQDISGLRLRLVDADALDPDATHTILEAPSGYAGKFDESALPPKWTVKYSAVGAALSKSKGTTIVFR